MAVLRLRARRDRRRCLSVSSSIVRSGALRNRRTISRLGTTLLASHAASHCFDPIIQTGPRGNRHFLRRRAGPVAVDFSHSIDRRPDFDWSCLCDLRPRARGTSHDETRIFLLTQRACPYRSLRIPGSALFGRRFHGLRIRELRDLTFKATPRYQTRLESVFQSSPWHTNRTPNGRTTAGSCELYLAHPYSADGYQSDL